MRFLGDLGLLESKEFSVDAVDSMLDSVADYSNVDSIESTLDSMADSAMAFFSFSSLDSTYLPTLAEIIAKLKLL
ncbi:hypothetical protein CCY99_05035 [Helicobacter sp. 16-1353]|uniref:hypothetical protein n=1 Tax=Helicobacter sp. 16-1353 TaxID=2004996 RepID=UPI000DCB74D7|nr:hypothetical protein [Helicobacter sp. 16-1353]RAX54048.1 hypothetical protein CCY99_05035 [Helicobacter sp. 16-1353]